MEKHKLIPAGYAVLKRSNEILLSRRFNTGYMDGFYSFPAGHAEKGETFLECAIRELFEETSLKLNKEDLNLVHVMHRYSGNLAKDSRIDYFYICSKWQGEEKNMEPDKCDDLKWVDIDHLPENTIPYIKIAVENIKNNILFSEI